MRGTTNRQSMPKLFTPEGYSAELFLTKFSANEIAQMEMEQGDASWIGVKKLIDDDYTWKEGFIVEGVNILPRLVARDFGDRSNIKAVFLTVQDHNFVREVIYNRGLFDDASKYSDDVKEKEVEWTLLFDHMLQEEAKKYNFPIVNLSMDQSDLEHILEALKC